MLQRLSWIDYWTTVGIMITVYYAVIALIYYKEEISQLLSRNKDIARAPDVQEKQVQE